MTDKLTIGDRIKIQGWVMMQGLDANKIYKLIRTDNYSYTFRKGRKLVRHTKDDIHLRMRSTSNENHIIKL